MKKILLFLCLLFSTHAFGSYSEIDFALDVAYSDCPRHSGRQVLALCTKFVKDKATNFTHSLIELGCPEDIVSSLNESCLLAHQSVSDNKEKIIKTAGLISVIGLTLLARGFYLNRIIGKRRLSIQLDFLMRDYESVLDLVQQIESGTHPVSTLQEVIEYREDQFLRKVNRTDKEDKLFESFKKSGKFQKTCFSLCNASRYWNTNNLFSRTCIEKVKEILIKNIRKKENEQLASFGRHYLGNNELPETWLLLTGSAITVGVGIYFIWI